jgi:hypothetical protein
MQSVGQILQSTEFKKFFTDLSKADYESVSNQRFLKFPLLIVNLIFFDTQITKRQIKILIFIMRFSFGCKQAVASLKLTDFQKIGFYSSDITKELIQLVEKKYIGWDKAKDLMWIDRALLSNSLAKDENYASEILRRNLANHFKQKKQLTSKNSTNPLDIPTKSNSDRYGKIIKDTSYRYLNSSVDKA